MATHPVIMHVLWDDRNRQVLAGTARRRRGDPETRACAEVSAPARRHPVARALARIALILARPKTQADPGQCALANSASVAMGRFSQGHLARRIRQV